MKEYIVYMTLLIPSFVADTGSFWTPSLLTSTKGIVSQNNNQQSSQPLSISENLYGGIELILSDNSTWEVYPKDTDRSGGWLGAADIIITKLPYPKKYKGKEYGYKLYNQITNDWVAARPIQDEDDDQDL